MKLEGRKLIPSRKVLMNHLENIENNSSLNRFLLKYGIIKPYRYEPTRMAYYEGAMIVLRSRLTTKVSDQCDVECPNPACAKPLNLREISLFQFEICSNPSCGMVTSRNLPFCESCWRPFEREGSYEDYDMVYVLRSVDDIHEFLSTVKKYPSGTYVIFEKPVSQRISKSWNQLKKGHHKEKSYAGQRLGSLLDPNKIPQAIPQAIADTIGLLVDEKEAFAMVPLSREVEMLYSRGFRGKYNDGDRAIIRKDFYKSFLSDMLPFKNNDSLPED